MRGYERTNNVRFGYMTYELKLLKYSFKWFKFQVVWNFLHRVMTILIDIGQLK
jgi:hypothetical protein